ncbi:hypothetical protein FHS38_002989 [Streptomyces netropsis]|uniref:Uncharacterized protein n=1 Tax=Streptomyces netropsis TaxID=55404 RepID=A0A7W7LB28_STRNE|nr:hypothetical protein [Streptomyces netropsis]
MDQPQYRSLHPPLHRPHRSPHDPVREPQQHAGWWAGPSRTAARSTTPRARLRDAPRARPAIPPRVTSCARSSLAGCRAPVTASGLCVGIFQRRPGQWWQAADQETAA